MIAKFFDLVGRKRGTIARLARLSGLPAMTVHRYATTDTQPRLDLFIRMVNAAGYDLTLTPRRKRRRIDPDQLEMKL